MFTGDSLLIGDVGRPDLHAAGDAPARAASLHASLRRLLDLPDHVVVLPSHYAGSVCGRGLSGNPGLLDRLRAPHNEMLSFADPRRSPRHWSLTRRRRRPSRSGSSPPTGAAPPARPDDAPVRLGLRENAAQFTLLVALNALVGGMVGLERSVLPLIGARDFGLRSTTAILAFVLAFGVAKALTNLAAGGLAERSAENGCS